MKYLVFFVLGVIFYALVMPILEDAAQVIHSRVEVYISKNNIFIVGASAKIEEIKRDLPSDEGVNAIGFDIPQREFFPNSDTEEDLC